MKTNTVNYGARYRYLVEVGLSRIQKSILVKAGPNVVFSYMDDVNRRGHHMLGMGRDFQPEILSENSTGVGATYRWKGSMYGVNFGWTEVVTNWTKDREKFHHSIEGSGWITRIDMGWSLTPTDGGTILTMTMDYSLGYSLFGKLLDWLWLKRYCNKGLDMDFQQMKETLEKAGEVATKGGQLTAEVAI